MCSLFALFSGGCGIFIWMNILAETLAMMIFIKNQHQQLTVKCETKQIEKKTTIPAHCAQKKKWSKWVIIQESQNPRIFETS